MADLLRVPLATIRKLEAGTLDSPLSKKVVRTLIALDSTPQRRLTHALAYAPQLGCRAGMIEPRTIGLGGLRQRDRLLP